jgi:hypothetical protein
VIGEPRSGDIDWLSPLRGFKVIFGYAFRGLAPTAKRWCRCAA